MLLMISSFLPFPCNTRDYCRYKFNTTMQLPAFTVCIPTPMVLTIFNSSMFNKPDERKASEVIDVSA